MPSALKSAAARLSVTSVPPQAAWRCNQIVCPHLFPRMEDAPGTLRNGGKFAERAAMVRERGNKLKRKGGLERKPDQAQRKDNQTAPA
ncbi:hypothetical protein MRX96_042972 [Rhipicephalus microplus]